MSLGGHLRTLRGEARLRALSWPGGRACPSAPAPLGAWPGLPRRARLAPAGGGAGGADGAACRGGGGPGRRRARTRAAGAAPDAEGKAHPTVRRQQQASR